ncbi:50S ribosomal protein L15 [Buchnera aphidicola (Taiwanaphis decaspermi)]|uniref:50S ribosomal protein L15 n=1 Tax=Buchnera aphidicola TaxID=9 RepID=UPI0031B880B0
MYLNTLSLSKKSKKKKKRVGRGIGSGLGKTCGRGHKGDRSRSGKNVRRGFEGGQTPLYRRIPKFGFNSLKSKKNQEVKLNDLKKFNNKIIDLKFLKKNNLISTNIKNVKIIMNTKKFNSKITIRKLKVTKGARLAIEYAGGTIEK